MELRINRATLEPDMVKSNDYFSPYVAIYKTGTIVTRVCANDKRLIDCIDNLLGSSRVLESRDEEHEPDINFELVLTDENLDFSDSIKRNANILYKCSLFDCWEKENMRWLILPERGAAECDLSTNRALAKISPERINSQWSVSHHIFYPLWAQMIKKSGYFHIHAACVSYLDQGVLFPGSSRSGKSTLTLNLVRNGLSFLGDDTAYLKREAGNVIATVFPEEVKVRSGSVGLFPELSFLKDKVGSEKESSHLFDIEKAFGARTLESTKIKFIIFPKFSGYKKTILKPISSAETLSSILDYSMLFVDPMSNYEHFNIYADLIEQAKCYSAEIGFDNKESVNSIKSLIEKGDLQ